jgi:hypothetical protein
MTMTIETETSITENAGPLSQNTPTTTKTKPMTRGLEAKIRIVIERYRANAILCAETNSEIPIDANPINASISALENGTPSAVP